MRPKSDHRQILLVYLFLGTIAVIFTFIEYVTSGKDTPLKGLFLNLATEIAGVVIIFSIVQYFLRDKNQDVEIQIAALRKEISDKFNPLFWEKSEKDNFNLKHYIDDSKEFYLYSYFGANLLGSLREGLPEAIFRGLKVKLLIIDPIVKLVI